MKPSIFIFIILFKLAPTSLFAQQVNINSVPKKDSVINAKTKLTIFTGLVAIPRLNFFGRTDSLQTGAVIPTVLVQFDSIGIYASASSVFVKNSDIPFTYGATVLELGYKFGNKTKGLSGNVYGDKFFYKAKEIVQSALQWQAGLSLLYQNKIVNVTSTTNATFSNRTDYYASGGLNHPFKIKKDKSTFLVTPTAVVNFGSQNFMYKTVKRNNLLVVPVSQQQNIEPRKEFNLLSYEFSVPILLARKNLFFIATPSYIVPQNIIKVENRPDLSETGGNFFNLTFTVLYSFKVKK
jgi:hypothetical protein